MPRTASRARRSPARSRHARGGRSAAPAGRRPRGARARRHLPAALLVLLACAGGCRTPEPNEPVQLTLVNRSGTVVTGVLLRFETTLARVDRVSRGGFLDARLRLDPADTLRLEGGSLQIEEAVTYEIAGEVATPVFVEGRWIIDGEFGAKLTDREVRLR